MKLSYFNQPGGFKFQQYKNQENKTDTTMFKNSSLGVATVSSVNEESVVGSEAQTGGGRGRHGASGSSILKPAMETFLSSVWRFNFEMYLEMMVPLRFIAKRC